MLSYASLIHLFCLIPHGVRLYPILFCLLTVSLPFHLLFSVSPALSSARSSLTGKSRPQWSQTEQKPLLTAALITLQQKLLELVLKACFLNRARVVLYGADHTLWIHSYLMFQETLLFPLPSPWFYSEFTFIVTEEPESSLLFIFPLPPQCPPYSISEATLLATFNLFSSTWLLTLSFCS